MTPIRHVLIAIDLSERSEAALQRGLRLARQLGARCTVMHALGLDAFGSGSCWAGGESIDFGREIAVRARAAVEAAVRRKAHAFKRDVEVRIEPGTPADAIPAQIDALGADLLVLGAHGEGFVRRMLFGATASIVLRKAVVPVLVVKNARRGDYQELAVAVDFSAGSAAALAHARRIAPAANVTLLHVVDLPYENQLVYAGVSRDEIRAYRSKAEYEALAKLNEASARFGLDPARATVRVVHGEASREILAHDAASGCDLLVLGKRGAHVTEELLLGSVTSHVLAQSRADVLVIRDAPRPEEAA
jgi:CPA2 family monovalent cation:H+ antiporter-2